jgi:hypothetical protein
MTRMKPVLVVGRGGPVSLADVFEGRRMLIVYHFMWKGKGVDGRARCGTGPIISMIVYTFATLPLFSCQILPHAVFGDGLDWVPGRKCRRTS